MDMHTSASSVVITYLKCASRSGATPKALQGSAAKAKDVSDYGIEHRPADPSSGAPLYDLTLNGIYPSDVYGPNGLQYYQTHSGDDQEAYRIIQAVHSKPDAVVTIYRAVSRTPTNAEKIEKYQGHKAYILKHGKLPPNLSDGRSAYQYYDWVSKEIERLKKSPEVPVEEITGINQGDWVTISRGYAKLHGKSTFAGEYKILSARAKAKHLFTDGNSWLEWGYYPGMGHRQKPKLR